MANNPENRRHRTVLPALMLATGLTLGLLWPSVAQEQSSPPGGEPLAYVLVSGRVIDDTGLEAYGEAAGPLAQAAGINVVARAETANVHVMEAPQSRSGASRSLRAGRVSGPRPRRPPAQQTPPVAALPLVFATREANGPTPRDSSRSRRSGPWTTSPHSGTRPATRRRSNCARARSSSTSSSRSKDSRTRLKRRSRRASPRSRKRSCDGSPPERRRVHGR